MTIPIVEGWGYTIHLPWSKAFKMFLWYVLKWNDGKPTKFELIFEKLTFSDLATNYSRGKISKRTCFSLNKRMILKLHNPYCQLPFKSLDFSATISPNRSQFKITLKYSGSASKKKSPSLVFGIGDIPFWVWLNIAQSIEPGYFVNVWTLVSKICPPTFNLIIEAEAMFYNLQTNILLNNNK